MAIYDDEDGCAIAVYVRMVAKPDKNGLCSCQPVSVGDCCPVCGGRGIPF
jgi:hypothetical protein